MRFFFNWIQYMYLLFDFSIFPARHSSNSTQSPHLLSSSPSSESSFPTEAQRPVVTFLPANEFFSPGEKKEEEVPWRNKCVCEAKCVYAIAYVRATHNASSSSLTSTKQEKRSKKRKEKYNRGTKENDIVWVLDRGISLDGDSYSTHELEWTLDCYVSEILMLNLSLH